MTEMRRVWLNQDEQYPAISVDYGGLSCEGLAPYLEDSFEVPAELLAEWEIVQARYFELNSQLNELIVERDLIWQQALNEQQERERAVERRERSTTRGKKRGEEGSPTNAPK